MKKLMILAIGILPVFAFAQGAPDADFLSQVLDLVKSFGGLSWMAKIAGICLLIIASMKVSILKSLVWDKIGAAQVWVAPVLGLIAGILSLGSGLSWAGVLAYVGAGAGAILLHELLDSIKKIPGIGPTWVMVIDFLSSMLGGNK